MAKEKSKNLREMLVYFLFCLVCAASNWSVYVLMTKLLNVDLSTVGDNGNAIIRLFSGNADDNIKRLFICTVTAWLVNVIVAFVTNKIWVFKSREKSPRVVAREFVAFFGSHFLTGILDWAGTPFLVMFGLNQSLIGIEGGLAKLIVSLLIMVFNYLIGKLLVFKKTSGGQKNV